MLSKINILPIVAAHFNTLRHAGTGRLSPWDFITQIGLPIAAGYAAFRLDIKFDNSYANLIAALAIVFGFAFAVTVFVFQLRMQMAVMQVSSEKSDLARISPQIDTRAPTLVNQLFSNCLYAVVLSGATTVLASIIDPMKWAGLGDYILVGLMAHLLLVLMMCFKRLNAAYSHVITLSS